MGEKSLLPESSDVAGLEKIHVDPSHCVFKKTAYGYNRNRAPGQHSGQETYSIAPKTEIKEFTTHHQWACMWTSNSSNDNSSSSPLASILGILRDYLVHLHSSTMCKHSPHFTESRKG